MDFLQRVPIYRPSRWLQGIDLRQPQRLAKGLDAEAQRWEGRYAGRSARRQELEQMVDQIIAVGAELRDLTEPELAKDLLAARQPFRRARSLCASAEVRALSLLREQLRRTHGWEAYPCQLLGALALRRGFLIEMDTGEGKTLTAALAAVLAAWRGSPVHVITVNDYLAERDAETFEPFYSSVGVRVASVLGPMEPPARREAYRADLVYLTSHEMLADFQRDRLSLGKRSQGSRCLLAKWSGAQPPSDQRVQRGFHTAIIDEADSVMIDDAVTPLILAQPGKETILQEACRAVFGHLSELREGVDYHLLTRFREVRLTKAGKARLPQWRETMPPVWQEPHRHEELVTLGLAAQHLYRSDEEYLIEEGKVVIVDLFTGRPMPGRTWQGGLHQLIEVKEGLELTPANETISRLSFQRFFRLFPQLAGMTGTAREAADEFWQIYRLPVMRIPRHRPPQRSILPPQLYSEAAAKWTAVAAESAQMVALGRAVLIGVRTIYESEAVTAALQAHGVEHLALTARSLGEEIEIISQAGQPGRVTVATHVAGRGTDIKLATSVSQAGGLHVILGEWMDSARIDRQFAGRGARQGEPGSLRLYASLEDALWLRRVGSLEKRFFRSLQRVLGKNASSRLGAWRLARAQKQAEHDAFQSRKAVLQHDHWLEDNLHFLPQGSE